MATKTGSAAIGGHFAVPDTDGQLSFSNAVLGDWEETMDQFFTKVWKKALDRDMSPAEVHAAIDTGYGDVVADCWDEWIGGPE